MKYEYVSSELTEDEYDDETEEVDSTLNREKYKLLLNYAKREIQ